MAKSARSVPGGSMPIRQISARPGGDALPTSVTQDLSHRTAESGKQSISGDARFNVTLGKGR